MQGGQLGGVAVMAGHARAGVFGVEHCVGDQLPDVVVVQAVEDRRALAAGADQPRHPQLRQMLRHRRGGFPDVGGQVVDRHLTAHQRPQHLDAGGIGQHPEHLDHQIHLIIGQPTTALTNICIHTQIISVERGRGNATDRRSRQIPIADARRAGLMMAQTVTVTKTGSAEAGAGKARRISWDLLICA